MSEIIFEHTVEHLVERPAENPVEPIYDNTNVGFFEIRTGVMMQAPVVETAAGAIATNGKASDIAVFLTNAHVLIKHNELELAQHLIRKSLYLDSHHPESLKMLAQTFQGSDRLLEKIKIYEALIRSEMNFDNLSKLAHYYYQNNEDQRAFAVYQEALSVQDDKSPELFEVFKNMGNLLIKDGDFEGAEEFYNKAFNLNNRSVNLLVNFGTLALQKSNYEEAKERFRTALEIDAKFDKAWVGLAVVHQSMGDFVLAKANIENALDINPSNRTAVLLSSSWGIRENDYSACTEHLQKYLETVEFDEEASLLLAHLFCLQGQRMQAQLEVERLLLWHPENEKFQQLEIELRNQTEQFQKMDV